MGATAVLHTLWDIGAWLSVIALLWYLSRRRPELFLRSTLKRVSSGYFPALSIGGIIGAYIFGTGNLWLSDQPGIGRSIVGGIAGAIAGAEIYKWRMGVDGSTGGLLAAPIAFGIALGRIGCHLAGLDDFTYGNATTLPTGFDYGDGLLRHPVALYESVAMALMAGFLFRLMLTDADRYLREGFYLFCFGYGAQRFAWEFLKPYGAVVGPFNLFHFLCASLMIYAILMLRKARRGYPAFA